MTRSEFLTQKWQRYPAMPVEAKAFGRIYSIERRESGPLALILCLQRESHKIDLEFVEAPAESEFLIEGDIIAVVDTNKIVLLSPNLESLPLRLFDSVLQKKWNLYLSEVRNFFNADDFFEVQTPSLVVCPGTEPSLDVFSTELKIGSRIQKLFLPTSPELNLKKVLASGAEKIFEFSRCFRNGEITDRHQPEFLMLEWYRAYATSAAIKEDVENLVQYLVRKLQVPGPQRQLNYSVAELFEKYCDFKLTPMTSLEDLKGLAGRLDVDVRSAESVDDYFFLIFMEKIETQFGADELIFVEKYPPYQAALARLDEEGWGERFEVYWKGLELANAFHELNDPQTQLERSEEDLTKKIKLGKELVPIDEKFMQALSAGMPPSAGIALGLERLFMAFYDIKKIGDMKLFPSFFHSESL